LKRGQAAGPGCAAAHDSAPASRCRHEEFGMLRTLAALAAGLILGVAQVTAAPPPVAGVRDAIDAAAAQAQRANLMAFNVQDHRDWLERFYAPAGYAPAWSSAAKARPAAAAAIAQLQAAPDRGLAPADYDADWLDAQRRRLMTGEHADVELAHFDVALTVAVLQYIADSHLGRLRSAYTDVPFEVRTLAFDPVEQLRAALAQDRLAQVVVAAEPGFPAYRRLKAALAQFRQLAARSLPPLPGPPAGGRKIEPGAAYAGAAGLRERLVLLGDLPVAAPATTDDRYEQPLVDAVKLFQARHGLEPDGVLGIQTLAELNTPLATRIRQIELSMERLRWLPYFPDGPLVAVNIPSFRLWALDAGPYSAEPALSMRVIVGRSLRTQTPAFVGEMRYIEFNPYWNVPPNITRKEILPSLRRDPGYLARNDMEFVGIGKNAAVSTVVDDAALAALRAGRLRVRQRPGATNALGTIKFGLPNSEDIYLHATPAKRLFARSRRDFSHGCIRLENPAALAQFVLRDQPEWNAARIEAAMAPGETRTVRLSTPIPVVIFYTTAIADREGRAVFAPDVYRLDESAARALARRSAALAAFWSLRH
jgi:murein L,D-transpeptidase YcbB/YkuD